MQVELSKYQKITQSVQKLLEMALNNADATENVVTIKEERCFKLSREDAEAMLNFLEKCKETNKEQEFISMVRRDYDEIPYIIGADETDSVFGQLQSIIECIKN